MEAPIAYLLSLINETLAAAIVIVSVSILLYNLTRNRHDRVARTSSVLLACVTAAYIGDVFISLGPGMGTFQATLRLQWIGIAFMPVATFHLSDALLATTGLPSRGRRRRIIRVLYVISAVFMLLAAFTDIVIRPIAVRPQYFVGSFASLQAGPGFGVYALYFLIVVAIAFNNVGRARKRCLTRRTRRRMGYLQIAMLTPAIGIFPFSILLGPGQEYTLTGLMLVNLANLVVILMLLFLSYPLSFFGSRIPDRVVKIELLRFMLRGPATGVLALATILFTAPASRILSLPGQTFMPFAVVTVVLFWQWMVSIALPSLEKRLVYSGDDYEQLEKIQHLSERLLTETDLIQLLEAVLSATCDYLRVSSAFVAAINNSHGAQLVATVGPAKPSPQLLQDEAQHVLATFSELEAPDEGLHLEKWGGYWVASLYSHRGSPNVQNVIGVLGIQARSAVIDLDEDERDILARYLKRAARALDDLALQKEIYLALEGLLPQVTLTREASDRMEYRRGRTISAREEAAHSPDSPVLDQEQFREQVRAALKHYWGGPGLTKSRLLESALVLQALPDNDNNPAKTLRAVISNAIESLRPDGERKMASPEWTLYNILELRFIKGLMVKEVFPRLSMSESDYHRKQNVAIQAVADRLYQMEIEAQRARAKISTPQITLSSTTPAASPSKAR
ncbi:hypothetical protein FBR02_11380 [Anaerolineae bacterium CFX9]|nr:hypothetical protein [Anaerolineae bacterium CFX9]